MNISLRKADASSYDLPLLRNPYLWAVIAAMTFAITIPADAATSPRPAHSSQAAAQTVSQEGLLWWLPADTESVVAARGPFPFPVPMNDEDEKENQDSENKKVSQAEIFQEFEQQALELFYSRFVDLAGPLRGSVVAFAMQGSRHFRDPLPGYEVMDFEGCSIVVFENDLGTMKHNLTQTLKKQATSTETIAGTEVLVFHQKDGDAEWDEFFAVPRPNVLLVANNLPYLREVLERMGQEKQPRAFPNQLPEWRFLNPDARFWGLRHYDRTQADKDDTSPFHVKADEAPVPENDIFDSSDQKAIGILFALDPANPHKAVMTYFSGDEAKIRKAASAGPSAEEAEIASFSGVEVTLTDVAGARTLVMEPQEGVKFQVKLQNPMPGVLEHIYTLDRAGVLSYFTLAMEEGLGRGMYF